MKKLIATIGLMMLIMTALPLVSALDEGFDQIRVVIQDTGLTVVTGTVTADEVAALPISVYCENEDNTFILGTAVTNAQGLFSVVYDNNVENNVCDEGDTVWAMIDNTNFVSRHVMVEDAGPYDYADADIQVPEFGVLAAFGIVALAGLFIYKKRD